MIFPRIFITYTAKDAAFATHLMGDLHEAGAEVITDNFDLADPDFEQYLREQLPLCYDLIMVQTLAALQSSRVRAAMDSALKLVREERMNAVFRVLAPDPAGVETQAVPLRWADLPAFDASQDYARAVARLCLKVGLDYTRALPDAPPPTSSLSVPASSDQQEIGTMTSIFEQAQIQGSTERERSQRPVRRRYTLLRWSLIILLLLLVFVVASVLGLIYQRSSTLTTTSAPASTVQKRSFIQPTLAVFKNQSYIAWTGSNGHLNIAKSSTGDTFTSPTMLSGNSAQRPALTVFNNQLYVAWIGNDKLFYVTRSNDGSTFTTPSKFGFTSIAGPALTVFNNQLYMAWTGNDKRLAITRSSDGSTFATPGVLPGVSSARAPALTVFNNQLYIAWTGSDKHFYVTRSNDGGTFITPDILPGASTDKVPELAAFNNQLYMAWTDTDNLIHIIRFVNDTTFTGVDTPGGTSFQGIALTVFNNQLYAAWSGTDNHLNIAKSSTGDAFTPPTVLMENQFLFGLSIISSPTLDRSSRN